MGIVIQQFIRAYGEQRLPNLVVLSSALSAFHNGYSNLCWPTAVPSPWPKLCQWCGLWVQPVWRHVSGWWCRWAHIDQGGCEQQQPEHCVSNREHACLYPPNVDQCQWWHADGRHAKSEIKWVHTYGCWRLCARTVVQKVPVADNPPFSDGPEDVIQIQQWTHEARALHLLAATGVADRTRCSDRALELQ